MIDGRTKEVTIRFGVSGYAKQDVILYDEFADLSNKQIRQKLESGELCTTIEEDGDVIQLKDREMNTAGQVVFVKNDVEFTDFSVEDA